MEESIKVLREIVASLPTQLDSIRSLEFWHKGGKDGLDDDHAKAIKEEQKALKQILDYIDNRYVLKGESK